MGVAQAVNFETTPAYATDGGLVVQTGFDPDGEGDLEAPTTLLDFNANVIRAYGDVTLIIDNFVYVSGSFEFKKSSDPLTVVLSDGTTKTVNALTVGASDVNAFVGVGDPDSDGDGDFDLNDDPEANGAIGLAIQDLDFGMAMFKPVAVAERCFI